MHFVRSKREAPAGNRRGFFVLIALGLLAAAGQPLAQSPPRGTVLADLTWVEAERRLTPDTVVVIPLGAEAKEHGPHLRLDNDARLAAYFRDRILAAADVVVAPTVNYHFYPAFVEYPGSTHLRFETARDLGIAWDRIGEADFRLSDNEQFVAGLFTASVLAPLSEEFGKSLGVRFMMRPNSTRAQCFLLGAFGVDTDGAGLIVSFLTALVGAVILLFVVKAVTKRA